MAKKEYFGGKLFTKDGGAVPLSKAIRAGDYIYLSGQLAFDAEGKITGDTIEEQTRTTLGHIKSILAMAGAELGDVIKCTCWISDQSEFARFNAVYGEYFAENPPTRSCIPGELLFGAKVEIEAIAYKPVE